MCRPLLRLCRPFMIFEGCLDSNPEYCRSNWRATDLATHLSPFVIAVTTMSFAILYIYKQHKQLELPVLATEQILPGSGPYSPTKLHGQDAVLARLSTTFGLHAAPH